MNSREKEIVEVALDDIIPNRFQPRLSFDEQALNELAKSISQHGIIQPLVLRKIGNKYEIIAGERRFKAAYIAGLTKVPAVIIELNDNESAEVAIVENLQRQDLSAIEEAKSYKKLLDRGYLTQDQLASRMGKTQATISNKLRLLNLDNKVQDALLNNQISERHARSLLKLNNKEDQVEMLDKIISNRLNVKSTEEAINNKINNVDTEMKEIKPNEDNFERNLTDNLPIYRSNANEDISNINIPKIEPIPTYDNYENDDLIDNSIVGLSNDEALNGLLDNNSQTTQNNPIPFIRPVMDDNGNIPQVDYKDTNINNQVQETVLPFNSSTMKDFQMVDEKIKNVITELNEIGFKVKLEEYDFENLCQYVIKVEKN